MPRDDLGSVQIQSPNLYFEKSEALKNFKIKKTT